LSLAPLKRDVISPTRRPLMLPISTRSNPCDFQFDENSFYNVDEGRDDASNVQCDAESLQLPVHVPRVDEFEQPHTSLPFEVSHPTLGRVVRCTVAIFLLLAPFFCDFTLRYLPRAGTPTVQSTYASADGTVVTATPRRESDKTVQLTGLTHGCAQQTALPQHDVLGPFTNQEIDSVCTSWTAAGPPVVRDGGPAPGWSGEHRKIYTIAVPGSPKPVVLRDHAVSPMSCDLVDPSGVGANGTPITKLPLAPVLFSAEGISPQQAKILDKVSTREGGFEAVNTYDEGYVSIGFLQFAMLQSGTGSAIDVLTSMKSADPSGFTHYFRSLGIDVDDKGHIYAVNPDTGDVSSGPDAVKLIQSDKRLTALFYRAGIESHSYMKAQVAVAFQQYWSPGKRFSVPVAEVVDTTSANPKVTYCYGQCQIGAATRLASDTSNVIVHRLPDLSGKYADVFRSEAGRIAIVDRNVQMGANFGPAQEGLEGRFENAVNKVANGQLLERLDLARHERDLIPFVQNRITVLNVPGIGQPVPIPDNKIATSSTDSERSQAE